MTPERLYEFVELIIDSSQSVKEEVNKFLQNEGRIVINFHIDKKEDHTTVYMLMKTERQ